MTGGREENDDDRNIVAVYTTITKRMPPRTPYLVLGPCKKRI